MEADEIRAGSKWRTRPLTPDELARQAADIARQKHERAQREREKIAEKLTGARWLFGYVALSASAVMWLLYEIFR